MPKLRLFLGLNAHLTVHHAAHLVFLAAPYNKITRSYLIHDSPPSTASSARDSFLTNCARSVSASSVLQSGKSSRYSIAACMASIISFISLRLSFHLTTCCTGVAAHGYCFQVIGRRLGKHERQAALRTRERASSKCSRVALISKTSCAFWLKERTSSRHSFAITQAL